MRKWTRTTLLFLAAASVYSFQGLSVAAENRASDAGAAKPEVKLVDDASTPVLPAGPTTKPAEARPAAEVNVSDAGTIDLTAVDANVHQVLDMLSLQSHKNIVASKEVRGNLTAKLYGVTLKEALDAVLKANGYGYREKGNVIYVYSDKELKEIEKSERKTNSEVFRLYYTQAAVAATMIKPVLSTEGQVAMTPVAGKGIETGLQDSGGDALATSDVLVVRDYPENIERVRKILQEIDRRPQQILVEATILSAKLTDDNALGIDFTILGGVSFNDITGAPAESRGSAMTGNLINNETKNGAVNYNAVGTIFPALNNNGLKVGVIYDNIALFVNALEQVTDTTVLANPKVLALNKQKGQVLVGRRDGYLTTTVTESSSVQTVEYLETGTKLMFRPFIGDDGYIRMEVHPEDSTGGVDVKGLPSKSTTEVTTNILVKDGNTVLIGGLFRESSNSARSQVPGLGNIPVVGALFKQQADTTVREEIIILLTPHIIKDENAYAAASEQQRKDFEKIRVGVRRGMMFFGRERLAECCYDSAVREMAKPNPSRKMALWHLDCATNLNPQFLEAIKMKERLTGREITSVDNSSVRYFLKKQILAERGAVENKAALVVPSQPQAAARPTTRPANLAQAPTTQPATVAQAPTTQPAEPQVAEVEDEEMACYLNYLKSLSENTDDTAVAAKPSEEANATTRPANGEENAQDNIVVVPQDDAVPLEDGEDQE